MSRAPFLVRVDQADGPDVRHGFRFLPLKMKTPRLETDFPEQGAGSAKLDGREGSAPEMDVG